MTLASEIDSFLPLLAKVYRASPNTCAAYRRGLFKFVQFLDDVDVGSVTPDHVRNYLARVPNPSTRHQRLAAIKGSLTTWRLPAAW